MNTYRLGRFVILILSAAAASAAGTGCSSHDLARRAGDPATGTLQAELTAVGPDGATYSLPPGTALTFNLPPVGDAGGQPDSIQFDSTTAIQSFSLPPGTYSAQLVLPGDGGVTLVRTSSTGSLSVAAILDDPQPYSFTVTAGATTNLVFHFTIAQVGQVTFGPGTLSTSLDVDAAAFPPNHGRLVSSIGATFFFAPGPSTTFATVNNALGSVAAGAPAPVTIAFAVTSPFQPFVEATCAPISATVTSSAAAGTFAIDASVLASEASGGTGWICFTDANAQGVGLPAPFGPTASLLPQLSKQAVPNEVAIVVSRTGTPQTGFGQAVLPASSLTFSVSFTIEVAPPGFFDGSTANFPLLNLPTSLTGVSGAPTGFGISIIPPGQTSGPAIFGTPVNTTLQLTI
jgi:hypothetical protein